MKEKTVYALGYFDGVHLGHQALLTACRKPAQSLNCKAAVLTFSQHPDALVYGSAPALINTTADRERLLRQFQIDTVVSLAFDAQMMCMPWQDFFRMLLEQYGAAGLVCGADFRFGDQGLGTAQMLKKACEDNNIPCIVVPEQKIQGITVSSSYIRTLLRDGAMTQARQFLYHPHILSGTVVPGRRLGRTLGIPTANLCLPQGVLVPKFGVYACRALVNGKQYPALTNIGTRPTVDGQGITVEAWLPDFEGDLYGTQITIAFYDFLRPEQKFDTLDALKAQIHTDAQQLRMFFMKK